MFKGGIVFILIALIFLLSILLTGCFEESYVNKGISSGTINNDRITVKTYDLTGTNFENLAIPGDYDLRQFEGITLNFIVENNINANILSHESEAFSQLTGINVKIRAMDYDTLVQKVNLDFLSQAGEYQLIYVDPYQTLNRFYNHMENLKPYSEDPDTPHIKGFPDDFFNNQTQVVSYFKEKDNWYAVPFDSTTMILYYRKDIFDKYRNKFFKEMGYDWTPGEKGFTWERYIEVARWIDNNVPDEEVKYGSGQMAQQHNSIYCEFSNILAAYGGDYFPDKNINTLGRDSFNKISILNDNFLRALDIYKEIVKVSAPESINWNWTDTVNAFRNGEIALMPNWDENSTYIEDAQSKVRDRVGYSILPYGDVRSANIYGGTGIGINKYTSDIKKHAAWLYITWATSRDMQLKILKHPEGGSMPTRKSAYNDPVIKKYLLDSTLSSEKNISYKHINAVLNAWKSEHIYLRPKIKNFYKVEQILIRNLHEMVENDIDSKEIRKRIYTELNSIRNSE